MHSGMKWKGTVLPKWTREVRPKRKHIVSYSAPRMEAQNWKLNMYPPKKFPLHYQDPRGSAKIIFLDSLSACKDM